jgi:hypothetical protein
MTLEMMKNYKTLFARVHERSPMNVPCGNAQGTCIHTEQTHTSATTTDHTQLTLRDQMSLSQQTNVGGSDGGQSPSYPGDQQAWSAHTSSVGLHIMYARECNMPADAHTHHGAHTHPHLLLHVVHLPTHFTNNARECSGRTTLLQ